MIIWQKLSIGKLVRTADFKGLKNSIGISQRIYSKSEECKILRYFQIKTDKQLNHKMSDNTAIDKKKIYAISLTHYFP